ncbi:MAG: hypothetical protein ACTSUV_04365 [Candidatus Ranarchaeia archaeon]
MSLPPMNPIPTIPNDIQTPVLYWVLNFSIPDFVHYSVPKQSEFSGKILIASRQLWSLMGGQTVRSCLIGPGIVKGVIKINNIKTEYVEKIGALIFDPTELRYDEPTPLIDIIRPEVIDPTSTARIEELEQKITKILVRRGKVLAPKRLAVLTPASTAPKTTIAEEEIVRIKVRHTSGIQRARMLLGGLNRSIYKHLLEILKGDEKPSIEKLMILRSDRKKFVKLDKDEFLEWMIVEKMQGTTSKGPPDTFNDFIKEFDETYKFILKNEGKFIF